MRERDWCKLHHRWHRDPQLRKTLRRHGPAVGGLWAYLIARSHAESHHERNPNGTIYEATVAEIAEDICADENDVSEMLDTLKEANLIGTNRSDDPEEPLEIVLPGFSKNQWPIGASQIRMHDKREREKRAAFAGNDTGVIRNDAHLIPIDGDRDRDKDRENPPPLGTTPPAQARPRTHEATPPPGLTHVLANAVTELAKHLGEDEEVWMDRIGLWKSANPQVSDADAVSAILSVMALPTKPKAPYRYFQSVVKRDAGQTKEVAQRVAKSKRENDPADERSWQAKWREYLPERGTP